MTVAMKRIVLPFLLAVLPLHAAAQPAPVPPLEAVRASFRQATLIDHARSDAERQQFIAYSNHGEAAIDVLLMQLYLAVRLPEEEVAHVLSLFRDDGTWSDVDYADFSRGGWKQTLHITRILALAKAYVNPEHPYYQNPELSRVLHAAIAWWTANKPVNPNWWHGEIGVPKKLAEALLLLRDELTPAEIAAARPVLDKAKFGRTGQNKVWLASINLMKGLLYDDPALVAEARKQMGEEIAVTEKEGIQRDGSFHQHGPQMQFGNYGLAFAENLSFWARVLKDTPYAFTQEQYDCLTLLVRDGLSWTVWEGFMDPSACGRQLHVDGLRGKGLTVAVTRRNMGLDGYKPVGGRYYPCSDYGVYRTRGWFASVRMQSARTIGFEYTNKENLLANFSADGVLLLLQEGWEYDNIFPFWDWRMLPGVTAYEDGRPIKQAKDQAGTRNPSAHVAGTVDGSVMTTTMEVDRDGLHALKTNFFYPDLIVCLGAGIRRSRAEISRITTALDQNLLAGDVRTGGNWAWHHDRGYISLDGAQIEVSTALQEGSWEQMAPVYKGKEASGRVFKAWIEHDPAAVGSYAYAIRPCCSAGTFKRYARSRRLPVVLLNTEQVQAVSYRDEIRAVIHVPGSYRIAGYEITATSPSFCSIRSGRPQLEAMAI